MSEPNLIHVTEGTNPDPVRAYFHIAGPVSAAAVPAGVGSLLSEAHIQAVAVFYNNAGVDKVEVYRRMRDGSKDETKVSNDVFLMFAAEVAKALPKAKTELGYENINASETLATVTLGEYLLRCLLVRAPKIKHPRATNWAATGLSSDVDIVVVFHGQASEQGVTDETSSGNVWKGDYRRMEWADKLVPVPGARGGVYRELNCLLTEENLRRAIAGLDLELRTIRRG